MDKDSIGRLVIDTVLEDTGFKKGSKELESACTSLVSSIDKRASKIRESFGKTFQDSVSSINKCQDKVSELDSKLKWVYEDSLKLNEKMKELEERRTPTEEYVAIQKQIENTKNKLDKLNERKEKFLENGGKESSTTFKNIQYDIDQLNGSLPYLIGEMDDLVRKGKAFTIGGTVEENNKIREQQDALSAKMDEINNKKADLNKRIEETAQKEIAANNEAANLIKIGQNAQISDEYIVQLNDELERLKERQADLGKAGIGVGYEEFDKNTTRIAEINSELGEYKSNLQKVNYESEKVKTNGFASHMKEIESKIKKAANSLLSFHRAQKKTNDSAVPLTKSILKMSNMFKLLILRMAMRAVIKSVQDGFKNLAQYSTEANGHMSALMSGLTQLKNSFATAFAPLLSVVTPILTSFINQISRALSYVAQFIAALTGKSTVITATAVQEDYAASLNSTASAAKKATGALASFDHMEVLNKKNTSGGGGVSPSEMFKTDTISPEVKKLTDKVKDVLKDLFRPMKNAWDKYGKNVMDAWQYALSNVKDMVEAIGKSFMEVWTNGTGERFCGNILLLLAMMLNMIGDFAKAFTEAWNDNDRGTKLLQSFFDMLNAILELILAIGTSFREVWNNGMGVEILGNIFEIITNIDNSVTNLAENFKNAWTEDNVGTKIIQNLADIFLILLGHVNNITKDFEEWTKDLDFKPILEAIEKLTESLEPLADTVGAGLEWFFREVLEPLAKWAIENAIPAQLGFISEALEALNNILVILQPVGDWLWNNLLEPIASWTGGMVVEYIKDITDALAGFNEKISDLKNCNAMEIFSELLKVMGVTSTSPIKKSVFTAGSAVIDGFNEGVKSKSIWDGCNASFESFVESARGFLGVHSPSTVFKEIGSYLMEGLGIGITDMASSITTIWRTVVTDAYNTISPFFDPATWSELSNGAVAAVNECMDVFLENWDIKIGEWDAGNKEMYLSYDKWYETFNNMNLAYVDIWSIFVETWRVNTDNWWKTMVMPYFRVEQWKLFGTNMKNGILSGFNVIISEIGGSMKKIIDIFNQGLSNISDSINDLISQYNSLAGKLGVSKMDPVHVSPIRNVTIPKLAKGGVIPPNSEFLAYLGDQRHGTNIEAPADLIKQMVKQGLAEMGYSSDGGKKIVINASGDMAALIQLLKFELAQEDERIGDDLCTT